MMYHIGDKFLLGDVLCEVLFINAGRAWVGHVEEDLDHHQLRNVTIAVLDEEGVDKKGQKAIAVVPGSSLAV